MSLPATAARPATSFYYRLFGLDIASDIDLGDLPNPLGIPSACVSIRRGTVPAFLAEARVRAPWFEAGPDSILVNASPVARFFVTGGREIVVEGGVDGSAGLRWRMLGLAFGALFQQRNTLALHTTVVDIGGRNIGLIGRSGAGKSTLAAFLGGRGHRLLIDDVCPVLVNGAQVMAEPGSGRLRLNKDTLDALGIAAGERLLPELDKFELVADEPGWERFPLHALVCLDVADSHALHPLNAAERLALCLSHTYCRGYLDGSGRAAANFVQCAGVARILPAYKLKRPLTFSQMDKTIDLVERAITELAA